MHQLTLDPFEELELTLKQLRQQSKTKQRYPQEVWDRIISLVKSHSLREVCSRLNISPSYLKGKMRASSPLPLEFKEVSMPPICSELVSIELMSNCGITAKIQGPASCLSYLNALLRG
jgi:hypothetical protein